MITIPIEPDDIGVRLDRKVRKMLPLQPLSAIYSMIRSGRIRINGKKTVQNYRLCENDILMVDVPETELRQNLKDTNSTEALASLITTDFYKRNFSIIYEDENLLACNKPSRLVVHPGTGHSARDTLIDLAKCYMLNKKIPAAEEPVLVHRIDRDTSGIILIAKNKRFLRFLHTHFRDNQIKKTYCALCHGSPKKSEDTIDAPLLKTLEQNSGTKVVVHKDGQHASTTYHVTQSHNNLSKMEITIATGRTHQIRVHMQHIGCPVVGDVRYGNKELDKDLFTKTGFNKRLYLHAYRVSFMHPLTNKRITLTAPMPEEFLNVMK